MSEDRNDENRRPRWPFFVGGLVVLVFVGVVLAIIFVPTSDVWTDDAYVTAHYATIAPRIPGQVVSVAVDDNQPVKAGQVLVQLDDRDYRTALAQAQAVLAHDRALVQDAQAAVTRQPSLIDQADAAIDRLQARLVFARQNAHRYGDLARTGAGSAQENQQTAADLAELNASIRAARADAEAVRAQLPILRAQHVAAQETVRMDEARVHQAELNLSYTRILAPFDGMVGERSVQAGNYVAPGAALMAVVPMNRLWIEANYRELALRHMRPGQTVRIHVDSYDVYLDGIVDSVPPASGAAFAPLAPENATGNFTKIVQRLPVKITLIPGQKLAPLLRMGFSVETTVRTGLENVVAQQEQAPQEREPASVTAK